MRSSVTRGAMLYSHVEHMTMPSASFQEIANRFRGMYGEDHAPSLRFRELFARESNVARAEAMNWRGSRPSPILETPVASGKTVEPKRKRAALNEAQ